MTFFYDPKTKKVKAWVLASFVVFPLILVAIVFFIAKQYAQEESRKNPVKQTVDIFAE